MTVAEKLFIACLRKKNHKTISQIQRKWLDGDEVKQYHFIMEYYKDHAELVGVKTFCDRFSLNEKESDARATYYLKELKDRYIFTVISDRLPKLVRGVKEDPRGRLEDLAKLVTDLSVDGVEAMDTLYSDDIALRKAEYEERLKTLGVTYLSMGCDELDQLFYGYRKQDLITIGGKAGQGKTWLLVYLAYLLDIVIQKRREAGIETGDLLFITNEMGEDEIKERLDCIRFRLPYGRFLQGALSKREKARYYNGLDNLASHKSAIRILYSCNTVEELATHIGMYKPCAVFIDGSYLMEGQMAEGWEKIVYITRNLKRTAKNFKVPITNTTQLKRGAGKTLSKGASSLDRQDEFAYSNSYVQDSDIAMTMFQSADMKYHDIVGMEVAKGRRVKAGTVVHFTNNLDNVEHKFTIPEEEAPDTSAIDAL